VFVGEAMPQQRPDLSPSAQPRSVTQGLSAQETHNEDIGYIIGRLHREWQLLQLERTAIVKRIGLITRTIAGLAEMFGADIVDEELQGLLSKRSE
jgi:hypothetical protein